MRKWFLVLGVALWAVGCATRRPEAAKSPGFTRLLASVVRIDVREATFEGGSRQMIRGVGSGVVVTADGYILTNAHVASPRSEDIVVTLANLERVTAHLVGWDHWTDLALLKLDADEVRRKGLRLEHAAFGDSSRLYPGQTVFAVGTPNGLDRTVTRGIVSNINRYFASETSMRGYETGYFNTWLQTDAAINPGNSGGPLVTEDGRVIGINTRSYLGADNLSFAVPANTARAVMEALRVDGEIERSYVGIVPGPLQDLEGFFGLEANVGMLVESVHPGSPASQAGLRPGDIVLEIDGQPVDGRFPEQLPPILNGIALRPVGSQLSLQVRRGGQLIPVAMTTELLESRMGEQAAYEKWGLSVQELTRSIAREQRLKSDDGVLVIGLQRAFPGDKAGLQRGDLLLSVNRAPIKGLAELNAAYRVYQEAPDRVLFEVERNHQVTYVVLKP